MIVKNKKALIIGVASKRSIAASIADSFSHNGAEIALTYQNDKLKSRVEDIAKNLETKYTLKDEKIWCQDQVGLAPFGYPFGWTSNIVHHYCLIFKKDE